LLLILSLLFPTVILDVAVALTLEMSLRIT
jgi:hypothetical protein